MTRPAVDSSAGENGRPGRWESGHGLGTRLIFGVRPNLPIQTIVVVASNPPAKVVDQGRPAEVEYLAELFDPFKVLRMRVPADRLLAVRTIECHLDERNAPFNQCRASRQPWPKGLRP